MEGSDEDELHMKLFELFTREMMVGVFGLSKITLHLRGAEWLIATHQTLSHWLSLAFGPILAQWIELGGLLESRKAVMLMESLILCKCKNTDGSQQKLSDHSGVWKAKKIFREVLRA